MYATDEVPRCKSSLYDVRRPSFDAIPLMYLSHPFKRTLSLSVSLTSALRWLRLSIPSISVNVQRTRLTSPCIASAGVSGTHGCKRYTEKIKVSDRVCCTSDVRCRGSWHIVRYSRRRGCPCDVPGVTLTNVF